MISIILIVAIITALPLQAIAQKSDIDVVRESLRQSYINVIPDSILNRPTIDSIIKALGDQYTFVAAPTTTAYLEDTYASTSMDLGIDLDNGGDSMPVVCEVMFGTPAYYAGLCINDTVYEIDDVSMRPKHWVEGMNAILSSKEKRVKFEVRRGKNELTFYVTRDPRANSGFTYWIDNNIAYIRFTHFGRSTGWAMTHLFLSLKLARIRRIVLDLRPCGGGNLQSALTILQAFAAEDDTLMRTCYRGDSVDYTIAKRDGMMYGKPLEILVGKGTASAAEVIAVAVYENDYGYVLGDTTYGKGIMQHQFDLPSGAWFQYTQAVLKGPHGLSFNKVKVFNVKDNRDKDYGTGGLVPTMEFNTGTVSFDTLRAISAVLADLDEVRSKYAEVDTLAIQRIRESLPFSLRNIGVYNIARVIWGEQGRLWFLSQQPRYTRWKKQPAIVRAAR